MTNPNQVVVSQVSDVTTVEIITQGPQGPTVPDGNKGDISVSSNGTIFSLNDNSVTSAKIVDGTIGKNDLIDYVKDTRISLELRAKLLTDKEVSEVNFSVTTENRVLYLVGIAQNNKELNKFF